MKNTLETTKKTDAKTELVRTCIDKKSTTHTIEQAVKWPTSVALNTHTLKGLGGATCIGRLGNSRKTRLFLNKRDIEESPSAVL